MSEKTPEPNLAVGQGGSSQTATVKERGMETTTCWTAELGHQHRGLATGWVDLQRKRAGS